nr:hypothetical protein [Streptomyces sp. MH191]
MQHDHRRSGPGARAGRVHPLRDPRQLRAPAREPVDGRGQVRERLGQHGAAARGGALVAAAQPGRGPGDGPGRGRQHPLLVQERADAAHLQRGQPLQPELLRAARLAECPRPVVRGRHMACAHLHDGGGGPDDSHDGPGPQRGAGARPEGGVGDDGGQRGHPRHHQGGPGTRLRVPLGEGLPAGLRLVQGAGVGPVLLGGSLGHRVQRGPGPGQQHGAVRTPPGAPHLLLHGARQQPLRIRAMSLPHATLPLRRPPTPPPVSLPDDGCDRGRAGAGTAPRPGASRAPGRSVWVGRAVLSGGPPRPGGLLGPGSAGTRSAAT